MYLFFKRNLSKIIRKENDFDINFAAVELRHLYWF